MRAYVLIETKVRMANKVAESLRSLKSSSAHLITVDTVTGPHDIIAVIEAADTGRIGQIVSEDIHGIEGVEKTISCFALYDGLVGNSASDLEHRIRFGD